jgi:hypothetical protein
MGRIVKFHRARQNSARVWRMRHGWAIRRFVTDFLRANLTVCFADVTRRYQEELRRGSEIVWDYDAWREALREAFEEILGLELRRALAREVWYDRALLPSAEVIDLCLTAWILGLDGIDPFENQAS